MALDLKAFRTDLDELIGKHKDTPGTSYFRSALAGISGQANAAILQAENNPPAPAPTDPAAESK